MATNAPLTSARSLNLCRQQGSAKADGRHLVVTARLQLFLPLTLFPPPHSHPVLFNFSPEPPSIFFFLSLSLDQIESKRESRRVK